jgi:putative mRNA 3-end processing factor
MAKRRERPDLPRIVWRDGPHLEGTLLWFDAVRRHHLSMVSHAGVQLPPARRGGKLLMTSATAALLGLRGAPLLADYGHPLALGPLRIELVPSGRMLGSAQALVETINGRVLYAGGVQTAGSATTQPAARRRCDVLLVEAGAGPRLRLPPRDEAMAELARQVAAARAAGHTPVVLAATPGLAQDVLAELPDVAWAAHASVLAHTRAFARLGVALPMPRGLRGAPRAGEAVLWPPEARSARALGALARPRFIWAGVGAGDAASVNRMRCDVGVAMSDTVDHDGLVEFATASGAQRIYAVRGAAAEVAADLRKRGLFAVALGSGQMSLF